MSETGQLEQVRGACLQLIGAADGALEWEWDGRFGTPAAAFGTEHFAAVQTELEQGFERSFSASDIASASARVSAVAKKLGGLRGGQLLWVTSPDAPVMLFCAWWPWGGGQKVSIRVGCDGDDAAPLKDWFGL